MPRKLPPHVERNRVKGHTYYSFRIGKGPRIRLPGDPTSPEFAEAYTEALAGNLTAARKAPRVVQAGTIAALVRSYKGSAKYLRLRDTTKAGYSSRLREIEEKHGHRVVAGLNPERIEKAFLIPNMDKPGKAHSLLKMLRVLIKHALATRMLKHDPSAGLERPKLGEIRSWTEEEIAKFEAKWPIGSRERLAFSLHLYTGQRRSDVHRMTWADVTTDGIRVAQQKTGAKLVIALHDELHKVLEAAPREHMTILFTAYGKPFTVDGFSRFMRDAITDAGLPLDCQPHGLRKAAGRRLAQAKCTPHQIMAVLGHKTLAEAERYTREVEQEELARSAIASLPRRKANTITQTTPAPFGEPGKKRRRNNASGK